MVVTAVATVLLALSACAPTPASAPVEDRRASGDGILGTYDGTTPLSELSPGTVLDSRSVQYHLGELWLPFQVEQILYRSKDMSDRPTANVVSVIKPWAGDGTRVVAYGSAYDSLNPAHEPSKALAGEAPGEIGSVIANAEALLVVPYLLQGYTVVITDTEGPHAEFAAGPAYGYHTLDGLRAALQVPGTGIAPTARIGLFGYSGGAIATEWAAELAPTYAPDIDERLVGASMGGVLVSPRTALRYVDGSLLWSALLVPGVIGVARAFGIEAEQYVTPRGLDLYRTMQNVSLPDALGTFFLQRLHWSDLVKAEYPTPDDIPGLTARLDQLVMGARGKPSVPLRIVQGTAGDTEGTDGDKPGIGAGDGVMVAGDVRTLARRYCAAGIPIDYSEHPLGHIGALGPWAEGSMSWLSARFAGEVAPSNCDSIAPGNVVPGMPAG